VQSFFYICAGKKGTKKKAAGNQAHRNF